ncbi:MAG TPA: DEAD/DEAH box helicase, partial [Polyangiales bacterium]|nr:DEAD/DEAH box helicase [Polyangiales bacterium]
LYARCPTLSDAVGSEHEGKLEELEEALELLCELRAAPDIVVEWPEGEALALASERDVEHVRLHVAADTDWLGADGELDVDDSTRLKLHDLLTRAAATRSRFIALDDGRYLALTDKLKKTLDGMSALATLDGTRVKLHPLWFCIAGVREDFAKPKYDAQAKRWLERVREAGQLTPNLPRGFEAELRGYQRDGFEWLSRLAHMRAGACLADDMGLGKTLQALALLVAEAAQGPALVVAPTSVCTNWLDEARRFAPGLRMHELASSERADTIRGLGPHDVLVCSYGLLQQEIPALSVKHFRVLILDEAQAIKNAATQRARAAQQLVGDIRIALTGTPVENHLGELWSIMHFLNPGLLGTARAFEERFGKPISRESDARAARTLKRLIRPFVLRRRKSEVLEDLPPKTVITLHVQPSDAERALFAAMRERALAKLSGPGAGSTSETRIQLLAELTRLRRAACHPQLVVPDGELASSKLEAFETLLAELREGGHRALVFSQFVDYLALVRARLDALGVAYQYLDGSCSAAARARAVAAFQAGEGDVFLISLKAGGFGLNLTAADYVVHLDPWWNPAVEDQASDRAHRIGQDRPVTIYRLVMQNSIEEKILALHHDKRDLADRLLEGTSSASTLSVAELMALFQPELAN